MTVYNIILRRLSDSPCSRPALECALSEAHYAPAGISKALATLRARGLVARCGGLWSLTEAGWRVEIGRRQAERLAGLRRDVARFRRVVAVLEGW